MDTNPARRHADPDYSVRTNPPPSNEDFDDNDGINPYVSFHDILHAIERGRLKPPPPPPPPPPSHDRSQWFRPPPAPTPPPHGRSRGYPPHIPPPPPLPLLDRSRWYRPSPVQPPPRTTLKNILQLDAAGVSSTNERLVDEIMQHIDTGVAGGCIWRSG